MTRLARWWQRHWQDVAGTGSVVGMALAYLSPALKDGWSFGPYDAGANETIGGVGRAAARVPYNRLNGDLIDQGIPWHTIDWRLIHAGQLPLWNPYNMLGLPQAFNFESAPFSLPDLLSYAVPLRVSWLLIVLVKLLIAGTGAYALSRQLGARPVAASFGGISFMLSGGFTGWLGWSLSGVVAWAPWVCLFMLLSYRDPRRRWPVLLATSVMFGFFGGFPEMYALFGGAAAAFAGFGAVALVAARRRISWPGCARVLFGGLAGTLLACPLLLPGAQLIAISTHAAGRGHVIGLRSSLLSLLVAQGYYGLPIRGSIAFPGINYYETVSYVGVIALALGLTGAFLRRHRAAVAGMVGLTIVCLVATYQIDKVSLSGQVLTAVGLGTVHPARVRLVTGLGVAVLGAVGLEEILHRPRPAVRLAWLVSSLLGAGLVVALIVSSAGQHLPGYQAAERFHSLVWPCVLAAAGLASAVMLLIVGRANRGLARRWRLVIGLGLAGSQAAFLLFAGVGLNSFSPTGFRQNPATTELKSIVGKGLVGLDGAYPGSPVSWPHLGFYPNINVAYRVAEFAAHDPLLPASYARRFPARRANGASYLSGLDIPDISSVSLGREYGIAYLLVQPGRPVPKGTTLLATLAGQRLVRVNGSERFVFEGSPGTGSGVVTSWSQPSDNQWSIHVRAPGRDAPARVLLLRISRVPGFQVTDNGRVLPVRPYGRFEMAVTVPQGVSTVQVRYWPSMFTGGILLAGIGLASLCAWCLAPAVSARRWARVRRARGEHRRRRYVAPSA
ncbi:MAG: hypothetical protein ACYDGN_03600 [Acidimicrobiales bacterium]